jgi:hypothetical protein
MAKESSAGKIKGRKPGGGYCGEQNNLLYTCSVPWKHAAIKQEISMGSIFARK